MARESATGAIRSGAESRAGARLAATLVAALLGAFILYGVGFAKADLLHNAAHDARHALSFPCH